MIGWRAVSGLLSATEKAHRTSCWWTALQSAKAQNRRVKASIMTLLLREIIAVLTELEWRGESVRSVPAQRTEALQRHLT